MFSKLKESLKYTRPRYHVAWNYSFCFVLFFGGLVLLAAYKDFLNIGLFTVLLYGFVCSQIIAHINLSLLSVFFYTRKTIKKDNNFIYSCYERSDFITISYLYVFRTKECVMHHEKYPAYFKGFFINDADTGVPDLDVKIDSTNHEVRFFIFGEQLENLDNIDHLDCYKRYKLFKNINLF